MVLYLSVEKTQLYLFTFISTDDLEKKLRLR